MQPEAVLAASAMRMHGAFTTATALDAGFSHSQVVRRVRSGAWTKWCRKVMTITGAPQTFEQRCAVAVLATKGAVISHEASGQLRRLKYLDPNHRDVVSISTPPGSHSPFDWVRTYHSSQLDPAGIETIRGLPVLTIERTMVDLAWVLDETRMGWVLDNALERNLLDFDTLLRVHRSLARRGRNGAGLIRPLLDARGLGTYASGTKLEKAFLEFVDEYNLPVPDPQVRFWSEDVAVGIVDFYWPELRIVIEADGRLGHLQRSSFEKDRTRDQEVAAQGCLPQRVTWTQMKEQPEATADRLRRSFEHQRRLHLAAPSKS